MGWDFRKPGTRICVCFDVSNARALELWETSDVPNVGQLTQLHGCGTNCGMCIPYFQTLLKEYQRGEWPAEKAPCDTNWFGAK